jgi:hypothetical protein
MTEAGWPREESNLRPLLEVEEASTQGMRVPTRRSIPRAHMGSEPGRG